MCGLAARLHRITEDHAGLSYPMNIFRLVSIAAALVLVVSCEKPQSEAEKNAQIEREVQQRIAAEQQADEQQRLAQQQADLEARERAIAAREAASSADTAATPRVAQRTEDRVASSEPSEARSYDTFYRKLDPYGAWRESSNYGYVWQPREAQQRRDWRPYTDGRWAYTDAGWTWISDEPFGWATYHYGRWTRLSGIGWVWVPGEEWAPAWVSWRTSDQHVGWAPLPPEARFERRTGIKRWADSYYDIDAGEYVFIPNEDIAVENVQRVVIPQERNLTIVNETTNVTNITYNNTTIVNEGPDFNVLRSRSRQPLERLRIQREYNIERTQTPQSVVRGETIAMMTPIFSARAIERPRTVGAPIAQATVERASANQPEAERVRAKMRAEATPPADAPPKRFEKPQIAQSVTAAPTIRAGTTPVPPATSSSSAAAPPERAPRRERRDSVPSQSPMPSLSATPVPTATPTGTAIPSTPAAAISTASPNARRIVPLATPTPSPSIPAKPLRSIATPTPAALATATPIPPMSQPSPVATATPAMTPVTTPIPAATAAQPSIAPEVSASPENARARGFERPQGRGSARAEQLRTQQEERNANMRDRARGGRNIAPAAGAPQQPAASPGDAASSPSPTLAAPANLRRGVPSRRLPLITPQPAGTAAGSNPALSPSPAPATGTSPSPTPTPTPTPSATP